MTGFCDALISEPHLHATMVRNVVTHVVEDRFKTIDRERHPLVRKRPSGLRGHTIVVEMNDGDLLREGFALSAQ